MRIIVRYVMMVSFLILGSCENKSVKDNSVTIDTLRVESVLKANQHFSDYRHHFGIMIPDYFQVIDSLPIDLNQDNLIDTVAILSPLYLENPELENNSESNGKRFLVEFINAGEGLSQVRGVYDNVVSNFGGVLSKYNGISKTDIGFEIRHQSGAKYSWSYVCEYSIARKDNLVLSRITKICSVDGVDLSREYRFEDLPLNQISIVDTLEINCNCDKLWMEIEEMAAKE